MKIIDIPREHSVEDYNNAIEAQVAFFSKIDGVKSMYQIGGVSTPGVSDIDLIVVFKDEFKYLENPRAINNDTANYLFTHTLYGVSETDFHDSLKYTFFHNHILLYGENIALSNNLTEDDQRQLKTQIALEFLIKMYVNLVVQKSYKTIKLRSLFLHVKALMYDFDFLKINPKPLLQLVSQGIDYRNTWFQGNTSNSDIKKWFNVFFKTYETFLNDLLDEFTFYSIDNQFKVGPNLKIMVAENVSYDKQGIVFPDVFNVLGKKHIKLLNRFNTFNFNVIMQTEVPRIVQDYFDYAEKTNRYNKVYLPYFMPLTSSLKMYQN